MAILDLLNSLAPWELINTFIIPLVLVFVIIWGLLTALRIFNKKINMVIALAIVLFLSSTDLFPLISQWMIQLGSITAVAAFLLLFLGGTAVWAINRGKDVYYGTDPFKAIERIRDRIAKLQGKMRGANEHQVAEYQREIRKLEDEIEIIRAKNR